jgi:hypothetical protein
MLDQHTVCCVAAIFNPACARLHAATSICVLRLTVLAAGHGLWQHLHIAIPCHSPRLHYHAQHVLKTRTRRAAPHDIASPDCVSHNLPSCRVPLHLHQNNLQTKPPVRPRLYCALHFSPRCLGIAAFKDCLICKFLLLPTEAGKQPPISEKAAHAPLIGIAGGKLALKAMQQLPDSAVTHTSMMHTNTCTSGVIGYS